jgi:hypothetical protein
MRNTSWGLWNRDRKRWIKQFGSPVVFHTKKDAMVAKVNYTKGRRNVAADYFRIYVIAKPFRKASHD